MRKHGAKGARALRSWFRDGAALARALAKEELRRAGFVPRDEMARLEATLLRLEGEVARLRQDKAGQHGTAGAAQAGADVAAATDEDDGTGDGA